MSVYLRAKFEVSSIILTSFRQGVILPPPPPPQNEPLKSPPRLGLINLSDKRIWKFCQGLGFEFTELSKIFQNNWNIKGSP